MKKLFYRIKEQPLFLAPVIVVGWLCLQVIYVLLAIIFNGHGGETVVTNQEYLEAINIAMQEYGLEFVEVDDSFEIDKAVVYIDGDDRQKAPLSSFYFEDASLLRLSGSAFYCESANIVICIDPSIYSNEDDELTEYYSGKYYSGNYDYKTYILGVQDALLTITTAEDGTTGQHIYVNKDKYNFEKLYRILYRQMQGNPDSPFWNVTQESTEGEVSEIYYRALQETQTIAYTYNDVKCRIPVLETFDLKLYDKSVTKIIAAKSAFASGNSEISKNYLKSEIIQKTEYIINSIYLD